MDRQKKSRPGWLECLNQKGNPSRGQAQDTGLCQPRPRPEIPSRQSTGAHFSGQSLGPFSKRLLDRKTKDPGLRIKNSAIA